MLRRDDHAAPGVDVCLGGDALHTAEVVHVAVGIDHAHDGSVTAVLSIELESRRCGLRADERIDDQDPGVTLDEADVREVQTSNLVDSGNDLEEAVHGHQLRLPPQARVDRVRGGPFKEAVARVVPHDTAIVGFHDAWVQATDEAATCVFEVGAVVERQ